MTQRLLDRSQVPAADTWDLASLFESDGAWDAAFAAWEQEVAGFARFQGTLGQSAQAIRDVLDFDAEFDRRGERLGTYALLKKSEDTASSTYQGMHARWLGIYSRAQEAASYIRPEILAIPDERMRGWLGSEILSEYRLVLERLLRYKPHTLGLAEERLLAMQTEMSQAARQAFGQLNDADLRFGTITDEKGEPIELSHASFSACLYSPDRRVRREAFHQYYAEYGDHANTLAATLAASIQKDVYYARARNYPSALQMTLFPDQVPLSVYDNLIDAVHRHLPALHRYYDVRRRILGLDAIHHYDTYVPIIPDLRREYPWDMAVQIVLEALVPLGAEYTGPLSRGLRGRWCDKYENKGKRSGAFSCGSFDGDPYILMNYQPTVLNHVFTLAHEAGHSMHSYFSARSQPYQYYSYTIFVAEVASTFNEELLDAHLLARAQSDAERAFYIDREIGDIRGTIFRQTMFAEFEKIIHELAERNEPLTLDRLRTEYRRLLEVYFGPDFSLDPELSLECLRIPHFYNAFYVYKYATGMSAAIALSRRVLGGGRRELDDYLGFLQGGCSKEPLDLLRGAGVDLERPQAVEGALSHFDHLVDELERLAPRIRP